MTTLHKNIKALRTAHGLTQKQLGQKVHAADSTVRMWELGKSTPNMDVIVELAQTFNVSTDYLLTGNEFVAQESILTAISDEDQQIADINKTLHTLNAQQLDLVARLIREIKRT